MLRAQAAPGHRARACTPRTSWPTADAAGGGRARADRPRSAGSAATAMPAGRSAAFDAAAGAPTATAPTLDTGLDPVVGVRGARCASRPTARRALTFATAACDDAATPARRDRQVPPARPRRARLADVGDAGRHPPARDAHQRRELRRDPDADDGARCSALRARAACAPPTARATSATGACCGASASRATGRSCWSRPASTQGLGLLRSLAQALRLWSWGGVACDLVVRQRRAGVLPDAAAARDRRRCATRHAAGRCATLPGARRRAASTCCAPTTCRADELSDAARAGARAAATPTAGRCCTTCRNWSSCTSRPSRTRHGIAPAVAAGGAGIGRARRPRRRANSTPRRRVPLRGRCALSRPRGPGSTCWPTPASARRSPKPAAATPGP